MERYQHTLDSICPSVGGGMEDSCASLSYVLTARDEQGIRYSQQKRILLVGPLAAYLVRDERTCRLFNRSPDFMPSFERGFPPTNGRSTVRLGSS